MGVVQIESFIRMNYKLFSHYDYLNRAKGGVFTAFCATPIGSQRFLDRFIAYAFSTYAF
jgi:hypothetical protein